MAEPTVPACDLVVIGGGGSGLVAAVKAAEVSGKKVIVLEKAKKAGGSTVFAHGFGVQNSKWQQEAGMPDTRDELFRRTMNNLKWKVNHRLVLNYIYSSGPFFDWLVEKGGAEAYFTKPEPGQKLEGVMAMMGASSLTSIPRCLIPGAASCPGCMPSGTMPAAIPRKAAGPAPWAGPWSPGIWRGFLLATI